MAYNYAMNVSDYPAMHIRLPPELMTRLRQRAENDRRSINATVAILLEDALDDRDCCRDCGGDHEKHDWDTCSDTWAAKNYRPPYPPYPEPLAWHYPPSES